MNALATQELIDFERLEKIVERDRHAFERCGIALAEIQDRKLYRKDYDSFEVYCLKRWGWTRGRSYQLITAAKVMKDLPPELAETVPTERVARELEKLTFKERVKLLRELLKASKKVTTRNVKVPPIPKNPPPVPLDRTDYPIPKTVIELWDRCEEIQKHLTTLSKLKTMVESAQETNDVAYAEVNFSSLIGHLSTARAQLAVVKGYAICTTCQGLNPKTCRLCRGRGFISEFLWNGPAISRQTKELRFKETHL